jgi:hypothetical protein
MPASKRCRAAENVCQPKSYHFSKRIVLTEGNYKEADRRKGHGPLPICLKAGHKFAVVLSYPFTKKC